MFNYTTLKESDSWRCPVSNGWVTGEYCSKYVVLVELNDAFLVKDHLPCYYIVGVASHINYQDQFIGAISHFDDLKDAEKHYSKLCEKYSVAESEVFNG